MWAHGIVVGHIFLQFFINFLQVVSVHHEAFVPHNELFLKRSVESLNMGIHFWRIRVDEVVGYFTENTVGVEVLEKL